MRFQRVLCPVDYSEYSARALRYAAALTGSHGAELHVLHVLPVLLAPDVGFVGAQFPVLLADVDADPHRTLRAFVDRAQLPLATTCVLTQGTTASREIASYAEEMRADLLVVGTHGRTGFDHVVLGSTTERLVHHAPCPVLTVPHDAGEPGAQDHVRFTSVLCAVDFSPASLAALGLALSIAREHAAPLTLAHVLEALSEDDARSQAHSRVGEYVAERRRALLQRLDDLVPGAARASGRISTLVELGRPAAVILRTADARQADLIVMGAQGHGGLGLMLFGSATQGVLRHATCPVLTARAMYRGRDVVPVRAYAEAAAL